MLLKLLQMHWAETIEDNQLEGRQHSRVKPYSEGMHPPHQCALLQILGSLVSAAMNMVAVIETNSKT